MDIGPVEYVIVGFPGEQHPGKIAPALADLIESATVRVLDRVVVAKDRDGSVVAVEFDQLTESQVEAFSALDADIGGVISAEDVEHVGSLLESNSSAAPSICRNLLARPVRRAVRDAGGVLLEGARIPHELVSAVEALAEQLILGTQKKATIMMSIISVARMELGHLAVGGHRRCLVAAGPITSRNKKRGNYCPRPPRRRGRQPKTPTPSWRSPPVHPGGNPHRRRVRRPEGEDPGSEPPFA